MGKTHSQKEKLREERLKPLPRSERLAKSAVIKKKEGRVLDASEKHALKMTTEYGEILRLWEVLRTLPSPDKEIAEKQQASMAKKAEKRQLKKEGKKQANQKRTTFGDDDEEDGEKGASGADGTAAGKSAGAPRATQRNEHKHETVDQLFKLITAKFPTYAKTPRISRVLQSMIKFGSNAHLERLLSLFGKDFTTYCNDAFASFAVCALIRHAPHALYRKLLNLIVPVMPQIVSHTYGMRVVNAAYSSRLSNALDRNLVALGVFKDGVAVMKHWPGYPVLEDILTQATDYKRRLLARLFDVADKLVSQKESFDYPFVQRLVHAYLKCGVKHEISELSVSLKKYVIAACETKDGAALASMTFAILPPGDRKELLRGISEKLISLATGKYSAPIIARLFDLVYDPQLLCKFVINGLLVPETLSELLASPYGYQIFVHILTPELARKERHLLPYWLADHNLYSQENKHWNLFDWLDAEFKPETVEICPKDAQRSHLNVLGPIVRKLVEVLPTTANKHNAMVLARELLHLDENMPLYKKVLALTPGEVAMLKQLAPEKALRDEDGYKVVGEATTAETAPAKKKLRTESLTAIAASPKQNVTPAKKAASVAVASPSAAPAGSAAKLISAKKSIQAASPAGVTPPRRLSAAVAASPGQTSIVFTPVPAKPEAAAGSAQKDGSQAKKKQRVEPAASAARAASLVLAASPTPRPATTLAPAASNDDDEDDAPLEVSARAGAGTKSSKRATSTTPKRPQSASLVMARGTPASTGSKRARAPEDF